VTILIIGLVLFLGIHSLSIVNEPLRNRMAQSMGEWPFKGLYSVVSAAGLIAIIWGYSLARLDPVALYNPPTGLRHLAMALLIPVFPLLLSAYLPGRIKTTLKHPMLVAVKLWALAHLLANGMAHDVLLFGSFLAWAVVDRISLKRRQPRANPALPATAMNDIIAVVAGLALYAVFAMELHARLIGVAPIAL